MGITTSILRVANSTLALTKTYIGGQTADNYLDATPVRDLERDIPAEVFNRKLSGVAEVAQRVRPGVSALAIPFEKASVLSGTIGQQAELFGWVAQKETLIYKDATLIGITAQYSAPLTAGQATIRTQIGGSDVALQAVLSAGANPQFIRAFQLTEQADPADLVDASAYEQIAVYIDTDGAFAPVVGRVNGCLWFNVGEEEEI
jgi:hypothetical protein